MKMDKLLESICFECVGDHYLKQRIVGSGVKGKCLNCGEYRFSIELETLSDDIAEILLTTVASGDLVDVWDIERDRMSHTERRGESLSYYVREILQVHEESNSVIDYVLGTLVSQSPGNEGFFDEGAYELRVWVPVDVEENWLEFRNGLMHKSRFFNHKAREFLEWLFEGIDDYQVWGSGPGVVRPLNPTESKPIFRARDCTPPKDRSSAIFADPTKQLAAPPKELAPAGRMSPAGVPVFYGAFERETCIAELRPPVGGKVISGEFKLTKEIRVFDFTALEDAYDRKVVSYFDPDYRRKIERRQFLKSFHSIISRPVVPGQDHEYLQTQVIAEYLATQHSPPIDAVIFASAQNKHEGGKNIVLFSQAISPDPLLPVVDEYGHLPWVGEQPDSAIEFVPESLMVHEIEQVKVKTKDTRVIKGQLESDIDDYYERGYWD